MVPESDLKPENKAFIALEQVTKMYPNGSLGLSEANLRLNQGMFLFVTGASGAGKSTLLKLLYGAERPSRGKILVNNKDIGQLRGDRLFFRIISFCPSARWRKM